MRKDKSIFIKGARQHNLKNISLEIPKDKITVISGVSGSGKSTLAFDTLFAEGQRRYIESLSSYARQFLGKLQKPDVDEIIGICPAIAIEQKTITKNPRSTVGTSTEIYDYLKLLFARIGKTYSPKSNNLVKKDSLEDIIKEINLANSGVTIYISVKIENKQDIEDFLKLQKTGFSRIFVNDEILKIKDITSNFRIKKSDSIELIIDRFIKDNTIEKSRIAESIETALSYGKNSCIIKLDNKKLNFSNKFELDGIKFINPTTQLFSFNNPFGACPRCEGYGSILGIDHNKVIQDEELSLFEGVVAPWSGQKLSKWKDRFIQKSTKFNFPIHRPYKDLKAEEKKILWDGKDKCKGINQFFEMLESKRYKIQARVMLARYRGKTKCNECMGSRLRVEATYVKINNLNIIDICNMSIKECLAFFNKIKLSKSEQKISERILEEVINRLTYLNNVGLQYLNLSRKSKTLSGGESQRINLATSLGSSLVGAMYILDEPSIGLHSQEDRKSVV